MFWTTRNSNLRTTSIKSRRNFICAKTIQDSVDKSTLNAHSTEHELFGNDPKVHFSLVRRLQQQTARSLSLPEMERDQAIRNHLASRASHEYIRAQYDTELLLTKSLYTISLFFLNLKKLGKVLF
eukprot:c24386_g1_i1.p1 GENE.c24386_g1_i1~~c24386_g1_i1.p1  ORF type:complete len:125 (+),score=25.93 c24386_g1_i1:165-539(+)